MPQAVHVQIVRQIALLQNLFEPECRCTRHLESPPGCQKTDSPLPPAPFTTLLFLPHFPYRIRTAYIFELCIWLRPAACGKIPFTRYFEEIFPILWAAFPLLLEVKARSGQFIFDCAFWGLAASCLPVVPGRYIKV